MFFSHFLYMEEKTLMHNVSRRRECEARMSVANCIYDNFKDTPCWMATANPYKKDKRFPKFQKLSYISDLLRKKISNFFIVRETNKTDDTAHYHVIIQRLPNNFRPPNGVQWHIQKIGGEREPFHYDPMAIPREWDISIPTTSQIFRAEVTRELGEYHHLLDVTVAYLITIHDRQKRAATNNKVRVKKLSKRDDMSRVVNYFFKEMMDADNPPCMYHNYNWLVGGQSRELR